MAHANLKPVYSNTDEWISPDLDEEDYISEQDHYRYFLEDQNENRELNNHAN